MLKVRPYGGRKRKDTPETLALLQRCLEQGMTRRGACALAGISEVTFRSWMAEKHEFLTLVQRAEAKFEQDMVAGIRREPKGKAWLLERRLRRDWQPPKLDVQVDVHAPLPVRFIDYKDGIDASPAEAGSGEDRPASSQEKVAGGG